MMNCELCGEPMPDGEEMFKVHGYSGPCPAPPSPRPVEIDWRQRAETLRAALVTLVGADGREELEATEAAVRASVAPAVDKAAGIDLIHALLATLPEDK